jgi:hypothetical protein
MKLNESLKHSGNIVFTVPVPANDDDASNKPADGLILANAPSREVLRLCPNGDIFVRGSLVENDRQVVDGLREFLLGAGVRAPAMKLFLVSVYAGRSYSKNLVEAESAENAVKLANPYEDSVKVEPIELKGEPGIRWCEEESPDSPRDRD